MGGRYFHFLSANRQNKHITLLQSGFSTEPAVMEPQDCVASPDVPVAILQKKILSAKSPEDKARYEKELDELIKAREVIRDSMHQIVEKCTGSPEQAQQVLNAKSSAYSTKEYKEVVEYFKNKGFNWHVPKYQTALQHLYLFANLIEEKVPVERIKAAIDEVSVNLRTEKDVAVSPNTE